MDENIVEFIKKKKLFESVEVPEQLSVCAAIGISDDGDFYMDCNGATVAELNWLLDVAKKTLLEGEE